MFFRLFLFFFAGRLMVIIMITPGTTKDFGAIIELWELSVRATHHFLPEEYLQEIKTLLPFILTQVSLFVYRGESEMIKGFAGVAEGKIEMLFIHPESMRQGIGRLFVDFCLNELHANKVDVNEQNEQAVAFYRKMNFRVTARQEMDSMGRAFPILQMQYAG